MWYPNAKRASLHGLWRRGRRTGRDTVVTKGIRGTSLHGGSPSAQSNNLDPEHTLSKAEGKVSVLHTERAAADNSSSDRNRALQPNFIFSIQCSLACVADGGEIMLVSATDVELETLSEVEEICNALSLAFSHTDKRLQCLEGELFTTCVAKSIF